MVSRLDLASMRLTISVTKRSFPRLAARLWGDSCVARPQRILQEESERGGLREGADELRRAGSRPPWRTRTRPGTAGTGRATSARKAKAPSTPCATEPGSDPASTSPPTAAMHSACTASPATQSFRHASVGDSWASVAKVILKGINAAQRLANALNSPHPARVRVDQTADPQGCRPPATSAMLVHRLRMRCGSGGITARRSSGMQYRNDLAGYSAKSRPWEG